jgi:hypothetical protein
LEHLKNCCHELQSALRQWENRIAELQQGYRRLGTVPTDLDSLRDFCRTVEPARRQLEDRTVTLERGCSSLDAVSQDLDRLRAFQSYVEHVHAGIQRVFNGKLTESSSVLLPDDKRS